MRPRSGTETTMDERRRHFIGAEVEPASGLYLDKFAPRTGLKIAEVAAGSKPDVDAAVTAAQAAFPSWRDRKPIERGRVLTAVARRLREHGAALARIEEAETGKPSWQVPIEMEGAAQYFEFY